MKPMILIVVPSLKIGGQERQALATAECLDSEFETLLVIHYAGEKEQHEFDAKCNVVNLKTIPSNSIIGKLRNLLLRTKKLRDLRRQHQVISVISFSNSSNLVNALSGHRGCTIASIRGYDALNKSFASAIVYRNADCVLCQTRAMYNCFSALYPAYRKKAVILNNGFDIEKIKTRAMDGIKEAESKESFVYVAVGRMENVKGFRHLLNAFCKVLAHDKKVRLRMVGGGSEYEALRQYAASLGIRDSVDFTGEVQNPYPYMRISDAYVLSSIHEGFPNTIVEAMVCGLPVIATDCLTGPREILGLDDAQKVDSVEHAPYGILVPSFSSDFSADDRADDILAKAMQEICENSPLRSHYTEQSLLRAEEYSIAKYKKSIINIINSCKK